MRWLCIRIADTNSVIYIVINIPANICSTHKFFVNIKFIGLKLRRLMSCYEQKNFNSKYSLAMKLEKKDNKLFLFFMRQGGNETLPCYIHVEFHEFFRASYLFLFFYAD